MDLSRRGLCYKCNAKTSVRRLYPFDGDGELVGHVEMTMEQLDAMEAEQRKSLPSWWHKDSKRLASKGKRGGAD